jgi:hypothetical protein
MQPRALTHSEVGVDALEQPLIGGVGEDGLRDDGARDRRHAPGIRAVDVEARVHEARDPAVDAGRRRGERRQDREQRAGRGVQSAELVVAREGEVEMRALQVRPAVAAAVEDAVEGVVDLVRAVWPELEVARGVHPGMHRGRQHAGAHRRELLVHAPQLAVESVGDAPEARHGPVRLDLDHVACELVRPGERAALDLVLDRAGLGLDQAVGDRLHVEARRVDDHVLELDAEALEEREGAARLRVGLVGHVRIHPRRAGRAGCGTTA